MRVGLLLCDHVQPAFQDEFGDLPAMFQAAWPSLEWKIFAVCDGIFPHAPTECDAYIASGSRYSVYDDLDWITHLKTFMQAIAQHQIPYLGVCFGHQLLAEALGGKVSKADSGWCVGVHTFDMQVQADWMSPFQPQLNLLMMCQDQVMELPPDSQVLATSPACPVGMFQVGDRMLGVQAHPEFSKAYNRQLMESRVDRMGTSVVQLGIDSLQLPLDAALFCQWSQQFLRQ